ncbi:lectin [Bacillus sp. SRB_336]|nr:lectin [Bacillus sp. SRB_336]
MMRTGLVLACATVLAACTSSDHPAAPVAAPAAAVSSAVLPVIAPAPATLARYDGYGDMRFGMDDTAFARAWAGELKTTTPAAGSSCINKRPLWVKVPADFAFMFEGGRFVRYDVGTAKESAPGGGKVGMGEAQIRSLYGDRVAEQPHKYVDGAKYLRVAAPQGNAMLVFETDATGKVTRWRVGVPPQIDYVEGCG